MRSLFMALAVLLVMSGATLAHHVPLPDAASDSDAFALYLTEQTAQSDGVVTRFMAYKYGKAEERSDLAKDAQSALVVTIEHMDGLDVRPCFATYAGLVDEFLATLVRYFEVVGASPALAEALFAYAGNLYAALTASVTETVAACAP